MAPNDKYFLVKLIPPRPSFAFDANEEERKLMQEHAAYWAPYIEQNIVVFFGPVLAKESWGLAIVETNDESLPKKIVEGDPTIRSGRGFSYEIAPMVAGFVRRSQ
jgi:uncharacterized protein YciI